MEGWREKRERGIEVHVVEGAPPHNLCACTKSRKYSSLLYMYTMYVHVISVPKIAHMIYTSVMHFLIIVLWLPV